MNMKAKFVSSMKNPEDGYDRFVNEILERGCCEVERLALLAMKTKFGFIVRNYPYLNFIDKFILEKIIRCRFEYTSTDNTDFRVTYQLPFCKRRALYESQTIQHM